MPSYIAAYSVVGASGRHEVICPSDAPTFEQTWIEQQTLLLTIGYRQVFTDLWVP